MTDERRDQRQGIAIKIRYKSATVTEFVERHSRDISRGGIFVKTDSPMPVGTLIKFDLRLEDEQSLIQGVGRVVWRREDEDSGSPSGMGIKFIKLDDTSSGNLETVLKGKTEGSGSSGEAPLVERQEGELPSKAPNPIAPVKPQTPPKGAKRTMLGMGGVQLPKPGDVKAPPVPGSGSLPVPQPSDKNGLAEKPGSDVQQARSSSAPAGAELPSQPLPEVQLTPAVPQKSEGEILAQTEPAAKSSGSIPPQPEGTETVAGGWDLGDIKEKSGDGEDALAPHFIADISSAIDNALSGPTNVPPDPETSDSDGDGSKGSAQIDDGPATGKGTGAAVPAQGRSSSDQGQIQSPAAGNKSGGSPLIVAICIVLILAAVGVLVWYLGLHETVLGSPVQEPAEMSFAIDEQQPEPVQDSAGIGAQEQPEPVEQQPEPVPVGPVTTITVKTNPPGAKVLVNGSPVEGVTPLSLDNIAQGKEIEVEVRKFGLLPAKERVLPGEKPIKVKFDLKAAKLTMTVTSSPPGAQILIDGKWWGKTPKTVSKRTLAGNFSYSIAKAGYEDSTGEIAEDDWQKVEGGFKALVEVTLNKAEGAVAPAPAVAKPAPRKKPAPAAASKPKPPVEKVVTKPVAKPKSVEKPSEKPVAKPKPAEKPAEKPVVAPKPAPEPKPKPKPAEKEKPKAPSPSKGELDENPFG